MRVRAVGRLEGPFRTSFIRIRTNSSRPDERTFYVPFTYSVSSQPGLYSTFDSLNFGLLSSLEAPKTLPVYLRNTHAARAIFVTDVHVGYTLHRFDAESEDDAEADADEYAFEYQVDDNTSRPEIDPEQPDSSANEDGDGEDEDEDEILQVRFPPASSGRIFTSESGSGSGSGSGSDEDSGVDGGKNRRQTEAFVRVPAASECSLVAFITCSPQRAQRSALLTGHVHISAARREHSIDLPFNSNLLRGSLVYDKKATKFFVGTLLDSLRSRRDGNGSSSGSASGAKQQKAATGAGDGTTKHTHVHELLITNTFDATVAIYNMLLAPSARDSFALRNATLPVFIAPNATQRVATIELLPAAPAPSLSPGKTSTSDTTASNSDADSTPTDRVSNLLVLSNASAFMVPLVVYSGKLRFVQQGSSPSWAALSRLLRTLPSNAEDAAPVLSTFDGADEQHQHQQQQSLAAEAAGSGSNHSGNQSDGRRESPIAARVQRAEDGRIVVDFGIVVMGESRTEYFSLYNQNPVEIQLNASVLGASALRYARLRLVTVSSHSQIQAQAQAQSRSNVTNEHQFQFQNVDPLRETVTLRAYEFATFALSIDAPLVEAIMAERVMWSTTFETIELQYVAELTNGNLLLVPSPFRLVDLHPFRTYSASLRLAHTAFERVVIRSLRFEPRNTTGALDDVHVAALMQALYFLPAEADDSESDSDADAESDADADVDSETDSDAEDQVLNIGEKSRIDVSVTIAPRSTVSIGRLVYSPTRTCYSPIELNIAETQRRGVGANSICHVGLPLDDALSAVNDPPVTLTTRSDCSTAIDGRVWLSSVRRFVPSALLTVDACLLRSQMAAWGALRRVGANLTLNLVVDSALVHNALFALHFQHVRPAVLRSSDSLVDWRKLRFPLTQLGTEAHRSLLLDNPTDAPLVLQLALLSVHLRGTAEREPADTCLPNDLFRRRADMVTRVCVCNDQSLCSTAFSIDDVLIGNGDGADAQWSSLNGPTGTRSVVLPPRTNATVLVRFAPTRPNPTDNALLLVRNNLTVLEYVYLQGRGARAQLQLDGRLPFNAVRVELDERSTRACDAKRELDESIRRRAADTATVPDAVSLGVFWTDLLGVLWSVVARLVDTDADASFDASGASKRAGLAFKPIGVRRALALRNTGELPLVIHQLAIDDGFGPVNIGSLSCASVSFELLDCGGAPFTLRPNQTRLVEVLFTPDFTASLVIRRLLVFTNLNRSLSIGDSESFFESASNKSIAGLTLPAKSWLAGLPLSIVGVEEASDGKQGAVGPVTFPLHGVVPTSALRRCYEALPRSDTERSVAQLLLCSTVLALLLCVFVAYRDADAFADAHARTLLLVGAPTGVSPPARGAVFDLRNVKSSVLDAAKSASASASASGSLQKTSRQRDRATYDTSSFTINGNMNQREALRNVQKALSTPIVLPGMSSEPSRRLALHSRIFATLDQLRVGVVRRVRQWPMAIVSRVGKYRLASNSGSRGRGGGNEANSADAESAAASAPAASSQPAANAKNVAASGKRSRKAVSTRQFLNQIPKGQLGRAAKNRRSFNSGPSNDDDEDAEVDDADDGDIDGDAEADSDSAGPAEKRPGDSEKKSSAAGEKRSSRRPRKNDDVDSFGCRVESLVKNVPPLDEIDCDVLSAIGVGTHAQVGRTRQAHAASQLRVFRADRNRSSASASVSSSHSHTPSERSNKSKKPNTSAAAVYVNSPSTGSSRAAVTAKWDDDDADAQLSSSDDAGPVYMDDLDKQKRRDARERENEAEDECDEEADATDDEDERELSAAAVAGNRMFASAAGLRNGESANTKDFKTKTKAKVNAAVARGPIAPALVPSGTSKRRAVANVPLATLEPSSSSAAATKTAGKSLSAVDSLKPDSASTSSTPASTSISALPQAANYKSSTSASPQSDSASARTKRLIRRRCALRTRRRVVGRCAFCASHYRPARTANRAYIRQQQQQRQEELQLQLQQQQISAALWSAQTAASAYDDSYSELASPPRSASALQAPADSDGESGVPEWFAAEMCSRPSDDFDALAASTNEFHSIFAADNQQSPSAAESSSSELPLPLPPPSRASHFGGMPPVCHSHFGPFSAFDVPSFARPHPNSADMAMHAGQSPCYTCEQMSLAKMDLNMARGVDNHGYYGLGVDQRGMRLRPDDFRWRAEKAPRHRAAERHYGTRPGLLGDPAGGEPSGLPTPPAPPPPPPMPPSFSGVPGPVPGPNGQPVIVPLRNSPFVVAAGANPQLRPRHLISSGQPSVTAPSSTALAGGKSGKPLQCVRPIMPPIPPVPVPVQQATGNLPPQQTILVSPYAQPFNCAFVAPGGTPSSVAVSGQTILLPPSGSHQFVLASQPSTSFVIASPVPTPQQSSSQYAHSQHQPSSLSSPSLQSATFQRGAAHTASVAPSSGVASSNTKRAIQQPIRSLANDQSESSRDRESPARSSDDASQEFEPAAFDLDPQPKPSASGASTAAGSQQQFRYSGLFGWATNDSGSGARWTDYDAPGDQEQLSSGDTAAGSNPPQYSIWGGLKLDDAAASRQRSLLWHALAGEPRVDAGSPTTNEPDADAARQAPIGGDYPFMDIIERLDDEPHRIAGLNSSSSVVGTIAASTTISSITTSTTSTVGKPSQAPGSDANTIVKKDAAKKDAGKTSDN